MSKFSGRFKYARAYMRIGSYVPAVKTWNETPNEIKASMSIKAFRKNTKTSC